MVCADVDVLATGMEHGGGPKQFATFATVVMHDLAWRHTGLSMAGDPFSPALIRKPLHLMNDGALAMLL